MEHYDLDDRIIMHNELQKALGKAKTNKAIRIDKIPNEIMKNHIFTEPLGPGPYAAYLQYIVPVKITEYISTLTHMIRESHI